MKAKFIQKYYGTGFEKDFVFLEYEYRGYTYTVYQNYAKGNEPLSWQHKNEQDRIDKIINMETKQVKQNNNNIINAEQAINELFEYWEQ